MKNESTKINGYLIDLEFDVDSLGNETCFCNVGTEDGRFLAPLEVLIFNGGSFKSLQPPHELQHVAHSSLNKIIDWVELNGGSVEAQ